MKNLGVFLLVFGVGSFILPMVGLQFKLMRLFGDAQPLVAAIAAVVGMALLVVSMMRQRQKA